jgi:hypothetical protein
MFLEAKKNIYNNLNVFVVIDACLRSLGPHLGMALVFIYL